MRKNKLKQMFKENKPIVNGWLQIPNAYSAEVMAHQGWDSCTIDMQHGVIDYPNALIVGDTDLYQYDISNLPDMQLVSQTPILD